MVALEIVNETDEEYVDPKTLVKEIYFRVTGNGTIDVVFNYGSNCPYGDKEEVIVEVYTGAKLEASITQITTAETTTTRITTTNEFSGYYVVNGNIEDINYSRSAIYVNTLVYISSSWRITDEEEVLEKEDVVKELSIGEKVVVYYRVNIIELVELVSIWLRRLL